MLSLEFSAESLYVNLFLANGNKLLLGGWKHIFHGGMGQNLLGMNTPIPSGFAPLIIMSNKIRLS